MQHKCTVFYHLKYSLLIATLLTLFSCGGMNEQEMLTNAKNYIAQDNFQAASIELHNILQTNASSAEANYLLGSINLRIGNLRSAEKEFRQAAKSGWDQQVIQLQLARILINKKAFKELLDEINPVDTWAVDTRANIAGLRALAEAGLNNTKKAKNTLSKGKALNKNAEQILRTTAILQVTGMLPGDASETLETAVVLYPDNTELLLLHATNDIQNKKLTRAAETYQKVISLDPAKLLTVNGRKAGIGLARLQLIEKNFTLAETTLAPLLKHNAKDPEANYLTGLLAFAQSNFNQAEGHIRKQLASSPASPRAHQLMGKIKYALKDFEQAAHHLTEYLNSSPSDNEIRKLLTNTYILLNQATHARATLQRTLDANPEDIEALILLSQIDFNSGNTSSGISVLQKATKHNPKNAQLRKQLASAYIRNGQTENADKEIAIYRQLSNNTLDAQKLTVSNYMQAGQIDNALKIAQLILVKEPKNPDTLALVGNLNITNNHDNQARTYFNKAIEIQQNHVAATMGLARLERKNGELNKAIVLYKNLVNANQAGTAPMLELSEIAAQQKRTNEMISWLEKARNSTPTEIQARLILTQYYLRNTQPKKAEIYINEAIKQLPEQGEVLALYGKVLLAQKRYKEALPSLKKLVTISPQSTAAHSLLGAAYLHLHMPDKARQHLQKALLIQSDNITALSLLAETELKDRNPDKTIELAITLQKLQAKNHIGYMLEGDAWMLKKNTNKAFIAYRNAWHKQQTAQLAKRLFLASRDNANFNKAVTPLLNWLKNNPDDSSTRFYLANVYQNANKNKKAIVEYEKILQQIPNNSAVLNNLAWLYSLNGNPKAMDMAESAYRFSPENPGILDTYGWILLQQGQVEKGKRLIKQAMDIMPTSLDIRFHYASALVKSGNKVEAKKILEELLNQEQSFTGREEAKRLLKNL